MKSNSFLRILIPILVVIVAAASFVKIFKVGSPSVLSKATIRPIYDQVVTHGLRTQPKIALTFDADMTYGMAKNIETGIVNNYYNKDVIDILETENVSATFFVSGLWAEKYPQITKDLSNNPLFEVGNHSYSHPGFTPNCFGLPKIGNEEKEFSLSQETLEKITGIKPSLFRFPGGCYQPKDLIFAKRYALTVIGWDVNGRDAFNNNEQVIFNSVTKTVKSGSIIVFHLNGQGNAPKTAVALKKLIPYLKSKGFTFVKVTELLQDLESQKQ